MAVALAFRHPGLLIAIAMIWGIAVIADSAQFSAAVTELADPSYVGTALTMQVALGFLLTAISFTPLGKKRSSWKRDAFTV